MENNTKICTGCKENKSFLEFGKAKLGKFGLKAICKKCHNAQTSRWQKENIERLRIKRRNQKKENPELISKKRAIYSMNRKEKRTIYEALWRKNNPGKTNARTARRRAARRNAMPKWLTKEQHLEMLAFYDKAVRLTKETGIPHEVDHIVPLQGLEVRGLHVPWNLRVIPRTENRNKSRKII